MNLEAVIEMLRDKAEAVARCHREQERARDRMEQAMRRLGEVAGVDVEDLVRGSPRRSFPEFVKRLRARGLPELDAAATIIEYHFAARR